MSKVKKIKDLDQNIENEHAKLSDDYKDPLELLKSIKTEGADYGIMMEPINEYCELVSARCRYVEEIEKIEASQAEFDADENV